ncbi:MAG: hypothetical protein AAGF14_04000 [Pseudomonadota bacterium]
MFSRETRPLGRNELGLEMIVCSCNVICHKEIENVVERMFRADPNVVLTPGKVYKAVGYRPKCATCLLHIGKLMHAHRESLESAVEQNPPKEPRSKKRRLRKVSILELEKF